MKALSLIDTILTRLLSIHLQSVFDFGFSQDGKFAFYTNLPDTITTWVVQAVGISNQTGLGVARALNIQTLKDFFVSLRLPYSVQRGEQISVIASVFNYGNFELKVKLMLVVHPMQKLWTSLYWQICAQP